MKKLTKLQQFAATLLAAACVLLPAQLRAQDQTPSGPQRQFATPDDAVKALREAAEAEDHGAMDQIFGPKIHDLMTGDKVQDEAHFRGFSRAIADSCVQTPDGDSRVILNIGTNGWEFPIPLVKTNGQWFFDTAAGSEEIINRHIGMNELHAIGFCRAYVTAQREYYSQDRDSSGAHKYAIKFKSSPGKQDGLYWKSTDQPSPFASIMAEAHAEGYHYKNVPEGLYPFHGYIFKIITKQGRNAPGGRTDYVVDGNLTGGFALVAFPAGWGKSGIMTFIVNQDGKVYERNLGERTVSLAGKITRYNPDDDWNLVSDVGISEP